MDFSIIKKYLTWPILKKVLIILASVVVCLFSAEFTIGLGALLTICSIAFVFVFDFLLDIGLFLLPFSTVSIFVLTGIALYKKNMEKFIVPMTILLILFTGAIVRIHIDNCSDPETAIFTRLYNSKLVLNTKIAFVANVILLFIIAKFKMVKYYYFYAAIIPFMLLFSLVRML